MTEYRTLATDIRTPLALETPAVAGLRASNISG